MALFLLAPVTSAPVLLAPVTLAPVLRVPVILAPVLREPVRQEARLHLRRGCCDSSFSKPRDNERRSGHLASDPLERRFDIQVRLRARLKKLNPVLSRELLPLQDARTRPTRRGAHAARRRGGARE